MIINDFSVVKLKDGRVGTVLESKEDLYLIEIDSKKPEIVTVKVEDILSEE